MDFNERFDRFARIYLEEDRLLTDAESEELVTLAKEATDAVERDPTALEAFLRDLQSSDPAVHAAASMELPLIRFWSQATSRGVARIEHAKQLHKLVAKDVLRHFGVPMGEAGIGVTPRGFKK